MPKNGSFPSTYLWAAFCKLLRSHPCSGLHKHLLATYDNQYGHLSAKTSGTNWYRWPRCHMVSIHAWWGLLSDHSSWSPWRSASFGSFGGGRPMRGAHYSSIGTSFRSNRALSCSLRFPFEVWRLRVGICSNRSASRAFLQEIGVLASLAYRCWRRGPKHSIITTNAFAELVTYWMCPLCFGFTSQHTD